MGIPREKLTGMKPDQWRELLSSTNYSELFPEESKLIMEGMESGINIEFTGNRNVKRNGRNLKSAFESKEVEDKVSAIIASDVASGKKAGPFNKVPFKFFSVSPIGAVKKKKSQKIRVIHHLSSPFGGD